MKPNRFFLAKASTPTTGQIYIYEDIGGGYFGGLSASDFAKQMMPLKDVTTLDVFINSYGGEVFDGVAIHNILKRHQAKKNVHIDGIAASIASIIAMAGDTINIAANAQMMIHDAWGVSIGNSDDMRKTADDLETINQTLIDTYVARTKGDAKQIAKWMKDESWMTAEECLARGFCDVITDAAPAPAENSVSPLVAHFKNAPQALSDQARSARVKIASMQMRADKVRRARTPATT